MTITGTPEAQWKSQYYIYDRIRQEGLPSLSLCFARCKDGETNDCSSLGYAGDDDVRLRAEIFVPTSLIGRLVGKGGQNVRALLLRPYLDVTQRLI